MDDRSNGAQGPQFSARVRQGSICNLTFDDVQDQLGNNGKPLNTMNFDELLKSVDFVEEVKMGGNQQNRSSSSSSSNSLFLGEKIFSKNIVDDVWKENVKHNNQSVPQGEITTLEDFLARAGVINPQPVMVNDPIVMVSERADWLQFQMGGVQQEQHHITMRDSESIYGNPFGNVGRYSKNHQLGMSMSATSPEKKCRYSDEVKERSIERRMIKNRESAARSRARKQAYTNQLEHEVLHLRKTNSWLKRQKDAETLLASYAIPVHRYQLRRTSSAPL